MLKRGSTAPHTAVSKMTISFNQHLSEQFQQHYTINESKIYWRPVVLDSISFS